MAKQRWSRLTSAALSLAALLPACSSNSHAVEIEIGAGEFIIPFRFVATGPAVDEGLMCRSGDVAEESMQGRVAPITFVCDDGSCELSIHVQMETQEHDFSQDIATAEWIVSAGTGDYENVTGEGLRLALGPTRVYSSDELDGIVGVITGDLSD